MAVVAHEEQERAAAAREATAAAEAAAAKAAATAAATAEAAARAARVAAAKEAAARDFSSPLFNCETDATSCFAVLCCSPIVATQLLQRHCTCMPQKLCLVLGCGLWIGGVCKLFVQWYHPHAGIADAFYDSPFYASVSALASAFVLLWWMATAYARCVVRSRDDISADTHCDDCLYAVFCTCCVQAQLMRHEGLTGGHYKLASCDGTAQGAFVLDV